MIAKLAKHHQCNTLIETGSFLGDTPFYLRHTFEKIVTIEFNEVLYAALEKRLKPFPNIIPLLGDSTSLLGDAIRLAKGRIVFFLDAHKCSQYGGIADGLANTPIISELVVILNSVGSKCVILIDDYDEFLSDPDYPSFLELKNLLTKANMSVRVSKNIIIANGLNYNSSG